ncbi:MAG: hypothetical protein ACR2NU_11575 [Aeoliella sp.]
MRDWLLQIDELLHGETTSEEKISSGLLDVSARRMAIVVVVLAMIYGVCMGTFSLGKELPESLQGTSGRVLQLIATTFKVPALFFLTLIVTFPSLYVFNALVGSRLRLLNLLRLLVASLTVNTAVLASLGLIVAFFSITTRSYPFVVILNVVVFGISGVLGLSFLLQTMHRLTASADDPVPIDVPEASSTAAKDAEEVEVDVELKPEFPSALDMPPGQVFARHTRIVFRCWVVLFAVVGAQMGWVLRPFIGNPSQEFTLFRERDSNFFAAILKSLGELLFGGW